TTEESNMDDQQHEAAFDVAAIQEKIANFEAKLKNFKVPNLGQIEERLAAIEVKANRPVGLADNSDQQAEIERKALATLIRTGSDHEVKTAVSSNDPEGGWMILPT